VLQIVDGPGFDCGLHDVDHDFDPEETFGAGFGVDLERVPEVDIILP
jgi:hypothetical protein